MSRLADIREVLEVGGWLTTTEIARSIPYTCRDFNTHRGDVYWKLRIMLRRSEVMRQKIGNECMWRLAE